VTQGRMFGLIPGDEVGLTGPQCGGREKSLVDCDVESQDTDKTESLSSVVTGEESEDYFISKFLFQLNT